MHRININFLFILWFAGLQVQVKATDIAIYYGPGAWLDGITAFEKFCDWKGISHARITPLQINTSGLTGNFSGIFFPGGDAYGYKLAINTNGLQNFRNLVNTGGFYIGICAGSYFACDSIEWEGAEYDYQLDLFNGWARGAIDAIAPWADYTMTDLSFNLNEPVNYYSAGSGTILYYGGPVYLPKAGQEMDTLATWNAWFNLPAMVSFTYGSGRVLFCGQHPEIEEDSDRDSTSFADELNDNGSDWPWLWTAVDWVMGRPLSHPYFWINEFHYDDSGSDDGEFVELVVPADFNDYPNLHLTLYDGLNGQPYQSFSGTEFQPGGSQDGYTFLFRDIYGLQNEPGGLALDYRSQLVQFLGYEGTFSAVSGPAAGLTCTAIDKSEDESVPENYSLQLSGNGKIYRDFIWTDPAPATKGSINSNPLHDQSLPVELLTFAAKQVARGVRLEWVTASELNNLGFILERTSPDFLMTIATYRDNQELAGQGTNSAGHTYQFLDQEIFPVPVTYRLSSVDYNGGVQILREIYFSAADPFRLDGQSPNPFNSLTHFHFYIPEAGKITLTLFDARGARIETLTNSFSESGSADVRFEASGLASGIYFYQAYFNSGLQRESVSGKMLLLR